MLLRRLATWLHRALDAWVLGLALFAGVGVLRGFLSTRGNWNWIWIDGRPLAPTLVQLLLLAFSASILLRARAGRAWSLLLGLLCAVDAVRVLGATHEPLGPTLAVAVPSSAALALLLLAFAARGAATWPPAPWGLPARGLTVLTTTFLAVLGHVWVVGTTHAHPGNGDAVVVLGAKVHPDGRPSGALEDRTHTACDLLLATPARPVVLSGGHTPGTPLSEPQAMARMCRERGVPEQALLLDESGATTQATVRAVQALAKEHGWRSVLVVSHDYHLARLQVAFRGAGLSAYTLPCRETHRWGGKPLAVVREVAAFLYYLWL